MSEPLVTGGLIRWIRTVSGLAITADNQAPVELALRIEAERHGLTPKELSARLIAATLSPQRFIDEITTNESYFFRAREQMQVVISRLVPELLARRPSRPVRVLSLPCARGEEPYSLAIMLSEAKQPLGRVDIVGGDISATCIRDARLGLFSPLALRRTDAAHRQRWFRPVAGGKISLAPSILEQVQFHEVNLLENAQARLSGRFDIVFCENLLIYFDPETVDRALEMLSRLIEPDGWLFVDHAEWNIPGRRFRLQDLKGCVGFQPVAAARAATTKPVVAVQPMVQPMPAAARRPPPAPRTRTRPPPAPRRRGSADPLQAAWLAHEEKRFSEALLGFERVLKVRPGNSSARLGKALVLADCGEDFEALETAEALISGVDENELTSTGTDYVEALVLIALLLRKKGLSDLSRGYFDEIARRDPQHPSLKARPAS